MKQFSKCLYMLTLSLMVMQGAWAQINYIERSWDATSNTVTNTEKSITGSNVGYDASPSEGQYKVVTGNSETWFQMGGYNNSIEEYYVVNGTVNLRNIVVLVFGYGGGGSGPARAGESGLWDDEDGGSAWDQL